MSPCRPTSFKRCAVCAGCGFSGLLPVQAGWIASAKSKRWNTCGQNCRRTAVSSVIFSLHFGRHRSAFQLCLGAIPLTHPTVIDPRADAPWRPDKTGKSTLFESPRLLVGLNAFEPGQSHALHAHAGMDKLYLVLEGEGLFLLEERELPMRAGDLM